MKTTAAGSLTEKTKKRLCACEGSTLDRLLQPTVMAFLANGPIHGYSLIDLLKSSPLMKGKAPDPTGVYRLLNSLEEQGMVSHEWNESQTGPSKRVYKLSPAGEECVGKWIDTLDGYQKDIASLVKMIQGVEMKKAFPATCGLILALGLLAIPPLCEATSDTIEIVVSPNVLNVLSNGTWVTVHADIAYSSVVGCEVTLNDVPVVFTKSDNHGDLVAKFRIGDIVSIVEPGTTAELTLSGDTNSGSTFSGTDMVRIIERGVLSSPRANFFGSNQ